MKRSRHLSQNVFESFWFRLISKNWKKIIKSDEEFSLIFFCPSRKHRVFFFLFCHKNPGVIDVVISEVEFRVEWDDRPESLTRVITTRREMHQRYEK